MGPNMLVHPLAIALMMHAIIGSRIERVPLLLKCMTSPVNQHPTGRETETIEADGLDIEDKEV